jgi:hypothetical protein
MKLRLVAGLVATWLSCAAHAIDADRLCAGFAVAAAGLPSNAAALDRSPTRLRQLPLFRELMAAPAAAPCVAAKVAAEAAAADSPSQTMHLVAALAGASPWTEATPSSRVSAVDPLAAGLDWLQPYARATAMPWPPPLPDAAELPEPLRRELGLLLGAIGNTMLRIEATFGRLPAGVDPASLRAQVIDSRPAQRPEHDLSRLLPLVSRPALADAALDLVAAVERFDRFAAATPQPSIEWQLETPFGIVLVDTTGRDNRHQLRAPLLVIDIGGNADYRPLAAPQARRASVLYDLGGNDRHVAFADGADPSAATLGIGLLWDRGGDDVHQGRQLAQGAAILGVGLLVDSEGSNRFEATGHAQGYAAGGLALLLASGNGNDSYQAVTHAQASAGPEGVAALIDRGGNDSYGLGNAPLLRPSPQLPSHNTSMGQGAGRGLRPAGEGDAGAAGGIGLLLDLAGNDRYVAQVFAQGAGYHEGLGLLLDGGGNDSFEAAWYAMGAAAHDAAGVLLKLGPGADRYRATHFTSLGAAHDGSLAVFVDEGGDDDYALGDLGLGASNEDGVAVFFDGGGRNSFRVDAATCRAFGYRQRQGSAVFVDRGCDRDREGGCPRHCDGKRR